MQLIALSLTLLATACLSAKRQRESNDLQHDDGSINCIDYPRSKVMRENPEQLPPGLIPGDSLQGIILKKYPHLVPPFLVSSKNWVADQARAFAVGLFLGKTRDKPMNPTETDEFLGNGKECKVMYSEYYEAAIVVFMKNLQKVICSDLKWKNGNQMYNPFAEFFDIQEIQKSKSFKVGEIPLKKLRRKFAKYAKSSVAMIAVDVAILQWMSHSIQENSKFMGNANTIIHLDTSLLVPICALTLYPRIQEFCKEDILTVFSEFQRYTESDRYIGDDYYFPTLLTLIRTLDEGSVRSKIEELAIKMYFKGELSFISSRLVLGLEHPFVNSMEAKLPAAKLASYEDLWYRQMKYEHRVYSLYIQWILSCIPNHFLVSIENPEYQTALIENDDSLIWQGGVQFDLNIYFRNRLQPKQLCLFIVSTLHAPAAFWKEIVSCTSTVCRCLRKL